MGRIFSVPAAVWCLLLFFLWELFIAGWIAFYIICPCCWPFYPLVPHCYPAATDDQCLTPPCVPKCCSEGEALFRNATTSESRCTSDNASSLSLAEVPLWKNGTLVIYPEEEYPPFTLVSYGLCPNGMYELDSNYDSDTHGLLEDGSLFMPYSENPKLVTRRGYCIDSYVLDNTTKVFRCFSEAAVTMTSLEKDAFPLGLAISLPFLLLTALVYFLLPELHNLHGKTLFCHVTSMSVAYAFLVMVQRNAFDMNDKKLPICTVSAFVIQFSFLATFFWLNVMCFDIWWVFSGLRPLQGSVKEREHKKFIFYSLYAWGCPFIIFVISICMELLPSIPDSYIKPGFGIDKCWFKDSQATVLYFYLPIGILVLLNVVMFVTTAFRLQVHRRETKQVLKGSESRKNDEAERQRFNLYLKLFIVMGINWVMELVSFAVGGPKSIWFVTDIGNTLQGLLIFLIFVWKRRILKLLNHKLCPRWDLVSATTTTKGSKSEKLDSAKTNIKK